MASQRIGKTRTTATCPPATCLTSLDQDFLLPPSISKWLAEGHLACFIGETVDSLDLDAFHARYAKGGPRKQPSDPAMMVKMLIHGYATGVSRSRKIAKKLHEDIAFRVVAAGNFPAHRALGDFRAFHLQGLGGLFVQAVRLARETGLVKLGTVAVDGTKGLHRVQAEWKLVRLALNLRRMGTLAAQRG